MKVEMRNDGNGRVKRDTLIQNIIGYYQIIGGGIGILQCLLTAFEDTDHILIYAIGLVLYCISLLAGISLIRDENKVGSYFNLALQIISCDFFRYSIIVDVLISFTRGGVLSLYAHLESNFLMALGVPFTYVAINIVPIVGIVYLRKLQIKADNDT